MVIQKVQYAMKIDDKFENRKVIHFETDSSIVLMGDGRTLEEAFQTIGESHSHIGSQVNAGEGGRAVITAPNGTISVSSITADELATLANARSNIQEQLDNKVKPSLINGNILIDDGETEVYVHPKVDLGEIDTDLDNPETEKALAHHFTEFNSVDSLSVDENGHITGLKIGQYKMPRFAQFYNTSVEPTDQIVGDFWLETLSVSVEPGNHFTEDIDGDLSKTETVGEHTQEQYSLEDIDSGVVIDGMNYSDFTIIEDL